MTFRCRHTLAFALGLALLSLEVGSAAAGCLSSPNGESVQIEGTLTVEHHQHPNGQEMRPFVLVLPRPACLRFDLIEGGGTQTVPGVTRIQLAGDFNVVAARNAIGSLVVVSGPLFGAETAWHVTPALILVRSLQQPAAGPAPAAEVARGFYEALGRADGKDAQRYLVATKRDRGAFAIQALHEHYGAMAPPLRITGLTAAGGDTATVEYRYGTAKGTICTNRALVQTVIQDGTRLITAIRADKDNCRRP